MDTETRARFTFAYLNQGEVWYPDGRPRLPITEMGDRWRGNAARWLERNAKTFLFLYELGELRFLSAPVWQDVVGEMNGVVVTTGPALSELDIMSDGALDAFDAAGEQRNADPAAWIRSTKLYRALVAQ